MILGSGKWGWEEGSRASRRATLIECVCLFNNTELTSILQMRKLRQMMANTWQNCHLNPMPVPHVLPWYLAASQKPRSWFSPDPHHFSSLNSFPQIQEQVCALWATLKSAIGWGCYLTVAQTASPGRMGVVRSVGIALCWVLFTIFTSFFQQLWEIDIILFSREGCWGSAHNYPTCGISRNGISVCLSVKSCLPAGWAPKGKVILCSQDTQPGGQGDEEG